MDTYQAGYGEALLTADARQGFVTSNAKLDMLELQRRTMQAAQGSAGNWVQAFPSALPSNVELDNGMHVGEPVFCRKDAAVSPYEQYPSVFTSFTGYQVSLGKILKEYPGLAAEARNSDKLREAALRIIEREVRFIGLSAKDVPYMRTRVNQPAGPTIAHAGTMDVWNLSGTTIPQHAWVCWRLPSVSNNPRQFAVQGMSTTKVTAEFVEFDPSDVRPSLANIKRKLTGELAKDPLAEALVKFVAAVMAARDKNPAADPSTAARAWLLSDDLKPKNGDVNRFLAETQTAIFHALSRIVGQALTPAKPNQQFTIHMRQLAI